MLSAYIWFALDIIQATGSLKDGKLVVDEMVLLKVGGYSVLMLRGPW